MQTFNVDIRLHTTDPTKHNATMATINYGNISRRQITGVNWLLDAICEKTQSRKRQYTTTAEGSKPPQLIHAVTHENLPASPRKKGI